MNDHLNENNIPGDGLNAELSADELALLKEALDAAYPPPKHSIRDGVMAQVKRECILAKRRALYSRIMKYGSLAACIALVVMAGIRILPALTSKSADMASYEAEALQNTAAAYDIAEDGMTDGTEPEAAEVYTYSADDADTAAADNGESMKKFMYTAVPETESEPSEAVEEEAVEAEAVAKEAEAPTAAAPVETAAETMAYDYADKAVVSSISADPDCRHTAVFADSYHTIPDRLIAITGDDVYLAWITGTSGCERNIADYLSYMEENTSILSGDIELIYDATDLWYLCDWNFGLLNAGDADAVEEYYANGGDFAGMVKRATEYNFKLALLDETGAEMTVEVCAWSIADLVEEHGMTLSTLTAVYEASADEIEDTYPGYEAQEYNLEALHDYAYSAANDEETPPDSLAPGRMEDAMFRVDSVTLK